MLINRLHSVMPFFWAGLAGISIVILFWPTWQSIVHIWSASETFTHGFFVVPVFLWLVWRKRVQLLKTTCHPDLRALFFISLAGAMWLLSKLAGIQVGEHFALALILVFTIWAVIGQQAASHIKFPLLFLLFLAPVGEELVPMLMELTADMTVWAIRNTGIPIYREGLFFSLPSGNWSVVEACSGIRYLIASSVLGSLYAYLTFTSLKFKIFFFAVSLIVPILANSIRAYIIVLLGHFSGNKIATGVDHLIYGWLFFGIVMFALFSIGAWLARYELKRQGNVSALKVYDTLATEPDSKIRMNSNIYKYVQAMVVILATVGSWPVWSGIIALTTDSELTAQSNEQILPESEVIDPDIEFETSTSKWYPKNSGHDARLSALFAESNLPTVRALAFVYVHQKQGKEMVNSGNVLVRSRRDPWRLQSMESKKIALDPGSSATIKESHLRSGDQQIVVWQWYRVGDSITSNALVAKIFEVRDQLLLRRSLSVNYMLVVDATESDKDIALIAALRTIVD